MAADPDSRIKDVLDDILTLVSGMDSRVDALEGLVYLDSYNALTSGQGTMPRAFATNTSAVTQSSQLLTLSYFTCRTAFTTTQTRLFAGATAAAATPTLVRAGIYLIDGAGAGTLVASFASDTAIFATVNTAYLKSWTTPYAMVAGQRYAYGTLVVTAVAAPILVGNIPLGNSNMGAGEVARAPRMAAQLAAQADLPASFTDVSLAALAGRVYATILPA